MRDAHERRGLSAEADGADLHAPPAFGTRLGPGDVIDLSDLELEQPRPELPVGSARTPSSRGPLLRFGKHPRKVASSFLHIRCDAGDETPSDHVRISGFQVEGPILVSRPSISSGSLFSLPRHRNLRTWRFWLGGAAIRVLDDGGHGPGQESPANRPGERIGRPDQVRIIGNYLTTTTTNRPRKRATRTPSRSMPAVTASTSITVPGH